MLADLDAKQALHGKGDEINQTTHCRWSQEVYFTDYFKF